MRRAYVYDAGVLAGTLSFDGNIYAFEYDGQFLENPQSRAISLTLPKQKEPFRLAHLHPFGGEWRCSFEKLFCYSTP